MEIKITIELNKQENTLSEQKVAETVQNIPNYEKLTDNDKIVLAVAIRNLLLQSSSAVTNNEE